MSNDIASATQFAVRAVLVADPALVAELGGPWVYDEVPDNTAPPYLRFGRIEPARDDTDGHLGWSVTMGLEAHTRPGSGRVSAQRLCGLVSAALHRRPEALTLPDWVVVDVDSDTFSVARQGDGKTYLGTALAVVTLSAA
ncbi:DUF3168 domain-containing protein [Sulfitobacter sp. 1A16787]|uniref:DUF3168 domain-containing protein n=1 Tax=Sulfitobacter sp. 1A16787 TaxID=3368571 RepID=UPI003745DC33